MKKKCYECKEDTGKCPHCKPHFGPIRKNGLRHCFHCSCYDLQGDCCKCGQDSPSW